MAAMCEATCEATCSSSLEAQEAATMAVITACNDACNDFIVYCDLEMEGEKRRRSSSGGEMIELEREKAKDNAAEQTIIFGLNEEIK
jgi:hypothetical protein